MSEYVETLIDELELERDPNTGEPGMGDINVMVKPSVLKDKTPMCMVNELARHNRIQHQYKLTKEEGPPHKKKFTVMLKLGESEYEAQGPSIKKAQHEAASIALRNTKYKHPPAKLLPNTRMHKTPTVELNALAMKRGEPTIYTTLSQPMTSYFHPPTYPPLNYYVRNIYQSRTAFSDYGYNEYTVMNGYSYAGSQYNNVPYKCAVPYKISLKVGNREYLAEGSSVQAARHKAAKKALDDLSEDNINESNNSEDDEFTGDNKKSPISAVHENAFLHNLQATFEVVDERGPPHMRTFVTECRVGDQLRVVGEGNGKRLSKRRAANKMLALLATLPSPKPQTNGVDKKRPAKRIFNRKRDYTKKRNSSEAAGGNKEPPEANPINRLMEYQKKRHEKEPVFVLVVEDGKGRRKHFSIQVKLDDLSYTGSGRNKREAKKAASMGMLKLLGLENDTTSAKEEPKTSASQAKEEKTENSKPVSPVNGKQIAPGILLVPHASITPKSNSKYRTLPQKESSVTTNGTDSYPEKENSSALSNNKYLADLSIQKRVAKDQLIRLGDKFGYEVQIADFPKGHHHQEFLSLVTLNTNPPQTYYGSGGSTEDAQNEAAFNALSMITEMGIENLFTKKISAFIAEKEMVS